MSTHIEKLILRNFRGVVRGELELAPLTILVGPNNSGKTTVLEALALAHGFRPLFNDYDLHKLLSYLHKTLDSAGLDHLIYSYGARVSRGIVAYYSRSKESKAIVMNVDKDHIDFYLIEKPNNIEEFLIMDKVELVKKFRDAEIAHVYRFRGGGTFKSKKVLADVLMIRYDLVPELQRFLYGVWTEVTNRGISSTVAEWVSQIVNEKYIDIVAEPFGGRPTLHFYRDDKTRIRVGDVGDGIKMLVLSRMVVELLDPDIVLWDDVESHMNPRALILLAIWLAELVEKGKQVVVTSHSLEAVKTIVRVASESVDTAIVRLRLENGMLRAERLSLEDVEELEELGIDIRA